MAAAPRTAAPPRGAPGAASSPNCHSSWSMEPTLDVGDRVVVNRLAYRLGDPQHAQVVVFLRPTVGDTAQAGGPISWVRRAVAQGLGGTPPGNEDLIKRVV